MARQNNKKNTIVIASDDLQHILSLSLRHAHFRKFSEANSLIDRIHHRHRNSPIFHRVNATIQLAQSESYADLPLQESLSSARKATLLSPSNLELSLFYAEVLVIFTQKFELGIEECKRALSIPNPVVLSDDERFGASNFEVDVGCVNSVEGQIEFCREKIRSLMDEAKYAIVDPSIVREYKKHILARKWYQDWTQNEKMVIEENPKRVQVKSYWESLTAVEMRRNWAEIDVLELREYCTFYGEAYDVLLEALTFAEGNCTWKFLFCPVCNEKFADLNSHLQHVVSEHIGGGLSGELKKLLPRPVSQDWAKKLVGGRWLPIDVDAAVAIFEQMPECKLWRVSKNEKRMKLLKRIGAMFRMLVKYRYLSVSHLDHVLNRAMEQVRAHQSTSLLTKRGVNEESNFCILVLDECHLTEILAFLDLLSEACKLGKYSEGKSFHDGHDGILDVLNASNSEVLDRIFLDCTSSKLIVDPRAFCKQSGHNKASCSCFVDGLRCMLDVEAVVSWLYKGKSWKESFSDWNVWRALKTNRGSGIFQMLQQEFLLLNDLCAEKREYFARVRDLKHVEQLCKDEKKKRGNTAETEILSRGAILMKVKEDASKEAERNGEVTEMVEAASTVLEVVQMLKKCITSYEEADVTSYSSSLNDLKDRIIETAFETLYDRVSCELNKIDAKIMQCLSHIQQLELKLGHYCYLDFLTVLTPLVKSYLQMFLEEAAENFAIDKSSSACKALLEEEGNTRHTDKGANHPRRSQKKSKGKKKCNRSK